MQSRCPKANLWFEIKKKRSCIPGAPLDSKAGMPFSVPLWKPVRTSWKTGNGHMAMVLKFPFKLFGANAGNVKVHLFCGSAPSAN